MIQRVYLGTVHYYETDDGEDYYQGGKGDEEANDQVKTDEEDVLIPEIEWEEFELFI